MKRIKKRPSILFVAGLQSVLMLTVMMNSLAGQSLPIEDVAPQPLAANLLRLIDALDYLGHPLPNDAKKRLGELCRNVAGEAGQMQRLIDEHVLFQVSVNPEMRVKVQRGPAPARLQQAGYTPCLVKLINSATVTRELKIDSPQAGPVYAGAALGILARQAQTELLDNENVHRVQRLLSVEMFGSPPMTPRLSGLSVEYVIALIFASESGQREATIIFDLGQGTQDLGFRSEVPVLFDIQPAIPVKLSIADFDGQPTTARLTLRDKEGHIYPPQAKRLAPDFFFQPHIYRRHGEEVLLPPGEFSLVSCRGPEYVENRQDVFVNDEQDNSVELKLERWVNPMDYGFFCGDHHIHGAGCSHYDNPTLGVTPNDMFPQVKGEGLNVGCVLTWGPCFEHQRSYFSPVADVTSQPLTVLKYDLEISGFGSASLGHVCLLNLNDQTYPNSEGTKDRGWPTWTVPVMRWAKEQGGVTGYPHSALHVDPKAAAVWSIQNQDADGSGSLSRAEAQLGLLPYSFSAIDNDGNLELSSSELTAANNKAADELPNLALPALNGGGAMEIFVSTAAGVCDFISAMDTARIPEWNTWYHLMNCGFPLKLSGETDFPCMSSQRVGQGRVYVQMGEVAAIDFPQWCRRLAEGMSYVSDGYAHALVFTVNGQSPGQEPVQLAAPGKVQVQTTVTFAPQQPQAVAYGTLQPAVGRRMVGDTVNLHAPRDSGMVLGGQRLVEIVVNGQVVSTSQIAADGKPHALSFSIDVSRSSWVALRQFPQLHTNPVEVIVANQPIRASRSSAIWCLESIRRLWSERSRFISNSERAAAHREYERAIQLYAQIADQCIDDGSRATTLQLPSTSN